jgi:hypothetical protein
MRFTVLGWLGVLALAAGLSGCGAPTIDGASEETFQASLEKMMGALPEGQKQRLTVALEGFEYLVSENALSVLDDVARVRARLRQRLDGLTAEDILELWQERLDKAITELEEKKRNTDAALEGLKAVGVLASRYYVQQDQPVVALKIHNKTPHTIARVYFHGTLTSPGRRKPWVEDDFNYNIPGGLEPNKSADWNFALLSAAWKDVPGDRTDLNLTVTITRIDGKNEEPIFDAFTNRFTKADAERLEKLKGYAEEGTRLSAILQS